MATDLFNSTIGNRSAGTLEENLSAFVHRFPVSGRIVHAIARETGGVIGLAERLDQNGLWENAELWMTTGKPSVMPPESIREIFNDETIDSVARSLGIPRESVEIQAALGIPKFFTTLAHEEDLGLGFNVAKKKRKTTKKSH
jgi:uncharacterized protein YidB (DUF937 family)